MLSDVSWKLNYLGQNGKAFVVNSCNPNFRIKLTVLCLTASKFTFKRYFDDERILFDVSLWPHSSHLSFWELINLTSAVKGVRVLLLVRADMREICRAANKQDDGIPDFYFCFAFKDTEQKQLIRLPFCPHSFCLSLVFFAVENAEEKAISSDTLEAITHIRHMCTDSESKLDALVVWTRLTTMAVMAPEHQHRANSQTRGYT